MKKISVISLFFVIIFFGCAGRNNVQTYKNQNESNKPRKLKDEVVYTGKKIGKGVVEISGKMWEKTKEGYNNTKEYIENR